MRTREYSALQSYEGSPSPFLTDRETAELTATAIMGPLALAAFDTKPSFGLPAAHEIVDAESEIPDKIDGIDGFAQGELLMVMRQQQHVAGAAIMFATRELN